MNEPLIADAAQPREAVPCGRAERVLLPVALLCAVLLDRFAASGGLLDAYWKFWPCYLALFTAFYWKRVKTDPLLWLLGGCTLALCAWGFFYGESNTEYSVLNFLVVPGVLMAHAALSSSRYELKNAGGVALAWLAGWGVRPFSGLPALFGSVGSLLSRGQRPGLKKVLLGLAIAAPVLCVAVPMLYGADRVFGYYVDNFLSGWNLAEVWIHTLVIALFFGLFYSHFWNAGLAERKPLTVKLNLTIDATASAVALGLLCVLYALFCGLQFTYLFAGAGLPGGMTYSEYAREGFAQTVAVCAMNLLLFGGFLRFGQPGRVRTALLAVLLGLTGVMLLSGAVRLNLYIGAYGLTWLRILPAWFILYLAAVILLCFVRLRAEKLPVVAVCAVVLLLWFVALGYADPSGLAARYNAAHGFALELR